MPMDPFDQLWEYEDSYGSKLSHPEGKLGIISKSTFGEESSNKETCLDKEPHH